MEGSNDYQLADGRHIWTRQLECLDDPAADVKVLVHDGHLLINVKGINIEDIQLPPTAFTGDARASYQRGSLRVDMALKAPGAPAMVEKALLDPDRPHPRELPLTLPASHPVGHGHRVNTGVPLKEDPTGHGAPTPAQAEYGERNYQLYGSPGVRAMMPAATLSSSVATDQPVLTNPGGAVEAVDNGETVVVDPRSPNTRMYVPYTDQLAQRLARAELAPAGTTVVRGSRDKVVEAEYERGAGSGGGRDEEAHADQYTRKTVDYTEERVGSATRPMEARDFYATAESATEPYSSVKAQVAAGDPSLACDMCRCAPCQCDKMAKGFPYELTPQEQKRSGKPHLSNTRKPVTGQNSHAAHDYRLHAKPRSKQHAQVEFRTREFESTLARLQEGVGSLEELPEREREKLAHTTTGGREIAPDLVRDRTRAKEIAQHFLG